VGRAGDADPERVRRVPRRPGPASGFQSLQYRIVEFLLGNKNAEMLAFFEHAPEQAERLRAALERPSIYDELLRHLARAGHPVPAELVERDWRRPHVRTPALLGVLKTIYEAPAEHWQEYELCEELVDVEESFQLWRFRHMKTVQRIIGGKRGTGGSSGVGVPAAGPGARVLPGAAGRQDGDRPVTGLCGCEPHQCPSGRPVP
jgi:tryptophan 2,3-dioxygenase